MDPVVNAITSTAMIIMCFLLNLNELKFLDSRCSFSIFIKSPNLIVILRYSCSRMNDLLVNYEYFIRLVQIIDL